MTPDTSADTDARTPSSAWQRFIDHESAGGLVLGAAALVALLLSNSPWAPHYFALIQMPGELRIGGDALVLAKPLVVWVNDLWMAVFFFLVGLEISASGRRVSWPIAGRPCCRWWRHLAAWQRRL